MVTIAIADGYLRPSENYVLRFCADWLGLSPDQMDAVMREVTGRPLPVAPDLSSASWWRSRRGSEGQRANAESTHTNHRAGAEHELNRLRALAQLGLDEHATPADIKAAFRRLTQVHHPDRFVTLGPEAVNAASESFRRLKQAYDLLQPNA